MCGVSAYKNDCILNMPTYDFVEVASTPSIEITTFPSGIIANLWITRVYGATMLFRIGKVQSSNINCSGYISAQDLHVDQPDPDQYVPITEIHSKTLDNIAK